MTTPESSENRETVGSATAESTAARRLRSASFPTRLLMLALSMFVLYIPTIWLHWPYVLGWFVGAIIVGLAEWARRG